MAINVHKSAEVHANAEIGDGCNIGPFCTVGARATIGSNTTLRSHVVVDGHTSIGQECDVFPFVTLGVQSQDLKYVPGTVTYARIGNRNIIREYVSIHSGTEENSETVLGNDCALLAQSHVAHNCVVGDHVTLSHQVSLGGHVTIGDYANLGGLSGVHQFCRVGRAAMVAGMAKATQDVLPYTIADGNPARMRVVNKIGMERAGYTDQAIAEVRRAFRTLFMRELRLEDAVHEVEKNLGEEPHIRLLLEAITSSKRGIARPETSTFEINVSN